MATALAAGTGPLFVAAGRPAVLLVFNVFELIVYGTMVYFAAPHGLTVVCACVATYTVATTIALYGLMSTFLGISFRSFIVETAPAMVATGVLVAVSWPVALELAHVSSVVAIPVTSILGIAAYTLTLRYVFPPAFRDVALLARRLVLRPS
jgi:hypothetical protein